MHAIFPVSISLFISFVEKEAKRICVSTFFFASLECLTGTEVECASTFIVCFDMCTHIFLIHSLHLTFGLLYSVFFVGLPDFFALIQLTHPPTHYPSPSPQHNQGWILGCFYGEGDA